MADEAVLDLGTGGVLRQADPSLNGAVATPGDFTGQFPTPVDTTELLTMCEELNVFRTLPEERTLLKTITYREMSSLAFTSGSAYISFADGYCPEEYAHDGAPISVDLKNIGAQKSLTISDIMHSMGSIQAGWGINALAPGWAKGEGVPGGDPNTSGYLGQFRDLKAKEMMLAGALVMNGWDNLLVNGNKTSNPLAFDGIVTQVTTANGAHGNTGSSMTGTFSAAEFDRYLSEGCAKPTHIFGHPQAIQEFLSSYLQLGSNQVININGQTNITPGYNFSAKVNTGVGTLTVVADANFPVTSLGGGKFSTKLYPLRMVHNGTPLVYKVTQIPLAFKDLAPHCTAISFMLWAKTALVIRAMCAQGVYSTIFDGYLQAGCARI